MTVEPGENGATATALKAQIEMLRTNISRLEALVAGRQSEFRATGDRDRAQALMGELLRITADLMSARETAACLESELRALRSLRSSRPWWLRMLAG